MAKIAEIIEDLKKGITALFDSEKYAEYLKFLSVFHSYSFFNTVLIYQQCPDATLVAPYRVWQKQNRYVKKGAKGIRIIAPHTYKDKNERGEEIVRVGFHSAYVFDLSQTGGDADVPSLTVSCAGALGDSRLLDVLTDISPVPVEYAKQKAGCNGAFYPKKLKISLAPGMSEIMTAKTLVHEIAHAYLHCIDGAEEKADRQTKEVQAESIAYVVLNYLGVDTSDYSFGYIAGWSSGRDLKELRDSMETIRQTADDIITRIDHRMAEDIAA